MFSNLSSPWCIKFIKKARLGVHSSDRTLICITTTFCRQPINSPGKAKASYQRATSAVLSTNPASSRGKNNKLKHSPHSKQQNLTVSSASTHTLRGQHSRNRRKRTRKVVLGRVAYPRIGRYAASLFKVANF